MSDGLAPRPEHVPVMLAEVLTVLEPRTRGAYVDATFGVGGYARAILETAPCQVWGLDRDAAAIGRAEPLVRRYEGRLSVLQCRFGALDVALAEAGIARVDGAAFDLGVSSPQIDTPERGFSFRADGPLDMRMGAEEDGVTAADLVATLEEDALARLLREYGEERAARRIAAAIVKERALAPITRTGRLASIVRRVLPRAVDGLDPATRTFQALRIAVNDELGELDRGLAAVERVLVPGGRLCVVAYHSLEDRRVKAFLRARSGAAPRPSRHRPDSASDAAPAPSFRLLTRRALRPSDTEIAANPRARSARLRAAERTSAPPWRPVNDERRAA